MSDLITTSYQKAPRSLRREFRDVYKESFGRRERMSIEVMKLLSFKKEILFDIVLSEKGDIVGFYYAYLKDGILFLYYLAVEENHRGSGWGKKILFHLEKNLKGSKNGILFVIAESIRKCGDNIEKKQRRSRFYTGYGFEISEYIVEGYSGFYDLYVKPHNEVNDVKNIKAIIKTLNPFDKCRIIKV